MYTVVWFVIAVLFCFSYILEYIETCKVQRELEYERKQNAELYAKCEQLADENASLAHDVAELRKRTVAYAFSDWEHCEGVTGARYYLEKDGIRLLIEDGKATSGFYSKDGPGEYIKPVAEVIDSDIV